MSDEQFHKEPRPAKHSPRGHEKGRERPRFVDGQAATNPATLVASLRESLPPWIQANQHVLCMAKHHTRLDLEDLYKEK